MVDIVRALVWFSLCAVAIFYAILMLLSNYVTVQDPTQIRDVLRPGIHNLSGVVMVSSPCDELSVQTQKVSPFTYAIVFQTWADPAVPCPSDPTPREFHATTFAPSIGVQFIATIDGQWLPIGVIPDFSTSTQQ